MFRKMRRERQEISADKCISILEGGKRGILAVSGDGGYPYAFPINYYYEDGAIYFHSAREGHKVDALMKNDKVSFCVLGEGEIDPGDYVFHFNSIIIFGRAKTITCQNEFKDMALKFALKYFPDERENMIKKIESSTGRMLMWKILIDHMSGKLVYEI